MTGRFSLIALLIFLFNSVSSQNFSVKGRVLENDKAPAIGAGVSVLNADSSFVKGTTTDLEGNFIIERVPTKACILKFSFLGFSDKFRPVNVDRDIDVGEIQMKPSATQLKEVEVAVKAPIATMNGDTTSYSSKAYKVNKDANAEDLVTKMPGITTTDGKVQAQGEDVKQVLVDGKPFFGDDANSVLKNLPAEIIEKVQVFDKKSDQAQFTGFDDGNASKTINIVTKAQFRNGVFGKVYGGGGYEDKYRGGAVVNRFKDKQRLSVLLMTNNVNEQNFSSEDLLGVMSSASGSGGNTSRGGGSGGSRGNRGGGQQSSADNFLVDIRNGITATNAAGLNYSDKWGKKSDISASYFFNWTDNKAASTLLRQYVTGGSSGLNYSENNVATNSNFNHRFNMRFDCKLDSQNSILLQPRISVQQNNGNSALAGNNTHLDFLVSTISNKFGSDLSGYNLSLPVLFRHSFKKRGRTFSVNLSPGYSKNDGSNSLQTFNQYFADTLASDTIDQHSLLNKYTFTSTGNVNYTEPLGKKSALSANYAGNYNYSDSKKDTYNKNYFTNEYDRRDSLLSNVFTSQYVTHSGGLTYRYNIQKINFSVGAAYQNAQLNKQQQFPKILNDSRIFESVLPNATFQYRFTSKNNLRINYRSSNTAPTIDQLQNVLNNSNSLQLSVGNPELKQTFQNNLNLRYSGVNTDKATSLFILLSGTYTGNYIGNSTIIAGKDTLISNTIFLPAGSQLSRPVNLNSYYNIRLFFNYSFAIKKLKSTLNINTGCNYNNVPAQINDKVNYSNTTNPSLGLVLSSNISEKLDFIVSTNGNYNNVVNTLQTSLNSTYFSQNSKLKITGSPFTWLQVQTEFSWQTNNGLSKGFNQNVALWNASVAYKFMKEKQAELRLFVFDILGQNKSIQRNTTETYIEDVRTNILQRYFLLTFTWNFKKYYEKTPNK